MSKTDRILIAVKSGATYLAKIFTYLVVFAAGATCFSTVSGWTMIDDKKLGIVQVSIAIDDEGNLLVIDRATRTYMLLDDSCGMKVAEMYNERQLK